MTEPTLELIPLKSALPRSMAVELHVLIKITPPPLVSHPERPPLNLGLVIDRSGSMGEGRKMPYALAAARFAIEQLVGSDRVSVTLFDDRIETIAPNQPASGKEAIFASLKRVHPRGSTALHGGWAEGAEQVGKGRIKGGLNRVLLLSDGLANVGLSAPDAIATEVHRMKATGIGTSTMGVGDDYNEDLMQAMARSGDGNYYFIDDPKALPELFGAELSGLVATHGTDVELRLEGQNGVEVMEVLNDFPTQDGGVLRLPNLISGMPILVVARLRIPPREGVTELVRARLDWEPTGKAEHCFQGKSLIVPTVEEPEWEAMTEALDVRERIVLLEAARLKMKASEAMAVGDRAGTRAWLRAAHDLAAPMAAQSLAAAEELDLVAQLDLDLDQANAQRLMKRAKYQSYARTTGRPQSPGSPGAPSDPESSGPPSS